MLDFGQMHRRTNDAAVSIWSNQRVVWLSGRFARSGGQGGRHSGTTPSLSGITSRPTISDRNTPRWFHLGGWLPRHLPCGSAPWSLTTTSVIQRCWPRRSPRSISYRAGGLNSVSGRVGCGPIMRQPESHTTKIGSASIGWKRRCPFCVHCSEVNPRPHSGNHYTVHQHSTFPGPVQPVGPPILIGAGKPRMLRLAGKYADIVGLADGLGQLWRGGG